MQVQYFKKIIAVVLIAFLLESTASCNSNQYLNNVSVCVLCSSSLPYCQNCTSNSSCVDCQNGSIINFMQKCDPCFFYVPYCSSCTALFQCDSCNTTTRVLKSTVTPPVCELCSVSLLYCQTCSNSTTCTSCWADPTIYLNTNETLPMECILCNTTYAHCVICTPVVCTVCINSTTITLFNGNCLLCSDVLANCLSCDSYNHCLSCSNNLLTLVVENGSQICKLCALVMPGCIVCTNSTNCTYCNIGTIVKNGCSNVPGCIEVFNIGYQISICLLCRTPEFHYIAQSGVCKCKKGHLTGSSCTFLLGCSQTNPLNTSECMLCSQRNRFQLANGTCKCIKTYYLSGDKCMQICGDGFLYDLECDDGNLIDGDGCSSKCKIQSFFFCKQGTPYTASRCTYNQTVCLSLISITKISNKNSIIIVLAIKPSSEANQHFNFSSFLTFNSTGKCIVTSVSFSSTNLFLTVDYLDDLDANQASISLIFNQGIIASPPCFLSFKLQESNGGDLMYQQQLSVQAAILQSACSYLAIFALLLLFIGSFAHKMIGVQTIHTIQLVFLVLICSPYFRTKFYNFKALLLSLGQIKYFLSASLNRSNLNYYLQFYVPYSHSYMIVGIAQFAAFLIIIVIIIRQYHLERQLQKELNAKKQKYIENTIKKNAWYRQLLAESYLFPIFIGFFFHFRLLLLNSYYNRFEKSLLQTGGMTIYCIINYIVFFVFMKNYILTKAQSKVATVSSKPYSEFTNQYVLTYLFFIITAATVIEVQLLSPLRYFNHIIALVVSFKLLTIVVYRPYKMMLHNAVLMFNLGTVIFAITWTMLQGYKLINNSISKVFQTILVTLLAFVELLCAIRIFICFREHYTHSLSEKSQKKKQMKRNLEQNDSYFYEFNRAALTTNLHERLAVQASTKISTLNPHRKYSKAKYKNYCRSFLAERKNNEQLQ